MKPFSDLDAILRDGHSLQYDWKHEGLQRVKISTHQVGELILTSGRIIAWDPLIGSDSHYYFKRTIKPGRYPVIVSVANFQPIDDSRIACAMLRISSEATAKWEVAMINDPDPSQEEELVSYGVDAGTGCFMDWDAAQAFENHPSGDDDFEEFCDQITAEMERNSVGKYGTAGWADVRVGTSTEANIIAFSSGWGDGSYASFWGFGASGELTSLVTDFALFPDDGPA
jgi:hypothetical protein